MLKKPTNYDDIQVNQEFEKLELGGHKGTIINVEEYTSDISGKTSLKIYVDTAKDDIQPEYFKNQYNNDTRENKKYPNGAIKYVPLGEDENQVKMLKSFLTCIENSNNGYTYNWDKEVNQLKGKKVGLVFGWEEYEKQDGTTGVATKLVQFRSIDKLDTIKIPKVKLLDGSFVEYENYHKPTAELPSEFTNIAVVDNSDLPFEI